jgi:hypothetical protein
MGVNPVVLRSLSGSSGGPGSPPGSSGRPGRRSTSSRGDLIVNAYKH